MNSNIWRGKNSSYNSYKNDSFGRNRVGLPQTQYEYDFQYNKAPLIWGEKITGSGSSTHLSNESSISLSNGSTTDTHGIIRQTFEYFRYRSGKTLEFTETFIFNAITENVIKRVGYFDNDNGIYLEQDGINNNYNLVLRTSITGTPVNNSVSKNNWNIDKMDGIGLSGINLDLTKVQIFGVDLQWLGVGSVLCGFVINRIMYPVHIFNHANFLSSVYMKTANLPLRYEIFNNGTAANIDSMKQICATVLNNAGFDEEKSYAHSVFNSAAKTGIGTTFTNLINIRPKATFNSIVNRGKIIPTSIEINNVSSSGILIWALIYNPSIAGSPSYSSAGNNSITEYDIAGTTVTNGEYIDTGHLIASGQNKGIQSKDIAFKYPITLDIDGLNPKTLVLAVRAITGTIDALGSIKFDENY